MIHIIARKLATAARNPRLVVPLLRSIFISRNSTSSTLTYLPSATRNPSGRIVWIISYTPVSSEPRVLRQAAAMLGAGWRVVVFGHRGASPHPPEWYFGQLPGETPYPYVVVLFTRFTGMAALALTRWMPGRMAKSWAARLYGWSQSSLRWKKRLVKRFLIDTPHLRPQLVISHDYFTCGAGLPVARAAGAKFVVDCHEYARGQYMHDERWVKSVRPAVTALQDYYLARADAVTTVCEGIAELLNKEQKLKRPVSVVRSVPFRNIQSFRPTGERIDVLYLGEIYYLRGLHKAIKSMPLWRPEFHLVLQGRSDPPYLAALKALAVERGVVDRVHFREPVPFDEIVPSANRADIGYFVHKDLSPQKRFALPNKFFEYVMAGLALCVSDLPEMARLVRQYDLGRLVPSYDEEAIAAVINSFDRDSINAYKRRSLAAAAELNWDVEKSRMLSLYESVLR